MQHARSRVRGAGGDPLNALENAYRSFAVLILH
jgi:hypothetical protein